jgi:DNA-directed RNA polymerase specialized sigma24 family protein
MIRDTAEGERFSVPRPSQVGADYQRLLSRLASRARWLGSRDPEGAAQEALKRSLENSSSEEAVRYYFGQDPPAGLQPPEWPLDRLLAWLHGVLHYVVREEFNRVSSQREIRVGTPDGSDDKPEEPADPAPDQLGILVQKELQQIVGDCFLRLEPGLRSVLNMRAEGLKYSEIAIRLRVNENTVATWVSRGIQAVARCVRTRTDGSRSRASRDGRTPHV